MVNAEDDLAPAPEEILIHRNIHRELVPVAVDPSREVMVNWHRNTPLPYHRGKHPEIITVVSSPEAMPCIVTSTVSR